MRTWTSFVVAFVLLPLFPSTSSAAVTPGTKCSKVGIKQTYNGKVYTCIKLGSKLYWNDGTRIISSKVGAPKVPSASATTIPTKGPTSISKPQTCVPTVNCPLGSVGPGGGTVFYDSGSQQSWGRYLEVSPNGWASNTQDQTSIWCDKKSPSFELQKEWSDLSSGDQNHTNLGTGRRYSEFILKQCTNSAAKIALLFRGGGKTDWFLPSSSELMKLFEFVQQATNPNLKLKEMGIDKYWYYWSSALSFGAFGWGEALRFIDGQRTNVIWSYDEGYIRPIRSF